MKPCSRSDGKVTRYRKRIGSPVKAQTIADMAGTANIQSAHLAEAIQYRARAYA